MEPYSKKIEILNIAQEIIQQRGYNGFSYADISKIVNIRKASIHHHFPSKAALTVALIRRYRENFAVSLANIYAKNISGLDKLREYGVLYEDVLSENKLCLCGMLASDMETLPRMLKKEIQHFFTDNVEWLSNVLADLNKHLKPTRLKEIAWQIISSLQGAVMMARMQDDRTIFVKATKELYSHLSKID